MKKLISAFITGLICLQTPLAFAYDTDVYNEDNGEVALLVYSKPFYCITQMAKQTGGAHEPLVQLTNTVLRSYKNFIATQQKSNNYIPLNPNKIKEIMLMGAMPLKATEEVIKEDIVARIESHRDVEGIIDVTYDLKKDKNGKIDFYKSTMTVKINHDLLSKNKATITVTVSLIRRGRSIDLTQIKEEKDIKEEKGIVDILIWGHDQSIGAVLSLLPFSVREKLDEIYSKTSDLDERKYIVKELIAPCETFGWHCEYGEGVKFKAQGSQNLILNLQTILAKESQVFDVLRSLKKYGGNR